MKKLAFLFAIVSAQLSAFHLHRTRSAKDIVWTFPKLFAGALAPFLALFGLIGAVLGVITRAPFAVGAGLFGLVVSGRYVWRVVKTGGDFDAAFGPNCQERIPPSRREHMLRGRWTWRPASPPEPRWQQNLCFAVVPGEGGQGRTLLCDLWRPPVNIPPSGLAFIYLHGSGWHFLDKDKGTRPLFHHLTAQGHVIMDVAYRLCPETDWRGMQADAKRAIAWMKTNAAQFGVDPNQIVIAGGSAGGHLALLAAYTAVESDLRPADISDVDLSVCGVVSWYGPSDMRVYDAFAGQKFDTIVETSQSSSSGRLTEWLNNRLGMNTTSPAHWQPGLSVQENMMRGLFGGTVNEVPEEFRWGSPITHVGPHCPSTLLLQGEHDFVVSAEAVRLLADKLREVGVPVVYVEYPQTDHAFDLILPVLSPSAQAALYETERFLALLTTKPVGNGRETPFFTTLVEPVQEGVWVHTP